ncbi:hypothetical protein ACOSQ4_018016 [Xanthoceras sorbifolium]
MASLIIMFVLVYACLFLLLSLVKIFHKFWWTPMRIQHSVNSQGIKGPSYRFMYGNPKEIMKLRKEASAKPMTLSHNIFSKVQPHVYSWINIYGKIYLNWYGPQPHLVVAEPELIKEIQNNKDGAYINAEGTAYVKKLLGNGLVTAEGEKWAKQRKLANYAFHGESLKVSSTFVTIYLHCSSFLPH